MLGWLTGKDNREAVLALLTIVSALLGGGWFLYDRLKSAGEAPEAGAGATQSIDIGGSAGDVQQVGPGGSATQNGGAANFFWVIPDDEPPLVPVQGQSIEIERDAGDVQQVGEGAVAVQNSPGAVIGYTIGQHEAALARREAQLRADLERAHGAERAVIQSQLDEAKRRMRDLDASFQARAAELERANVKLAELAGDLPADRLAEAREALSKGDTAQADALFAEVEALAEDGIANAAAAAFERGKLAESEIRWAEAAGHFAKAARLDPEFDHLAAARNMAWRSGDYRNALRHGEDLLEVARADHGEASTLYATAANEHALTLLEVGLYDDAEPLYREALTIGQKTLGRENPGYATYLNNFALLLEAMGRYDEAEPRHREALATRRKALGREHPDVANSLNNLALLLQTTGRYH